MKTIFSLILVTGLCTSCFNDVDLTVDTLFLDKGDAATQRKDAVSTLYRHYMSSSRSSQTYEVISKKNGRFIINFVPGLKLLTTCSDPGSGWSRQFKDVDEAVLKKLVDENISLDDLDNISFNSKLDSLLVMQSPLYNVNTNGHP